MKLSKEKNVSLADVTYFGVGGRADEFIRIKDMNMVPEIWAETMSLQIPFFVIGSGSNLVCSDNGFRGRIFHIDSENEKWNGNSVTVDAGKNLQQLILDTTTKGFSDLTNLAGIPGTVGGAVRGNAGAFGSETKDALYSVEFCDKKGTTRTFSASKCQFAYRESIFKKNPQWCVLRATFKLQKQSDPSTTLLNAKTLIRERWQKYPPGKCGGSFFKNPVNVPENAHPYAGWLLENAGAKGDRIGGAQISEKHANFLMNSKNATQKDVIALARKWQQIVFKKYNVSLEPEVMLIDEYGKRVEI